MFGRGKQSYVQDERAILLNIKTRVKSFLHDTFWQMDFGIDWWNLLGAKEPNATTNVVIQVRAMIAETEGVVNINAVSAKMDRATRKPTISFDVDTIFTRNLVGNVQP